MIVAGARLHRYAGTLVVVESRWAAGGFVLGSPLPGSVQTLVVRWAGGSRTWEVGAEDLRRWGVA